MVVTHPILAAASVIESALKDVAGVDPMFMATSDKATALCEVAALEARLADLKLRLLASADDVAGLRADRDAAAWWAKATRGRPEDARADLRLASALDRRWGRVAAGLREGVVNVAQAKVIVRALDALPVEVPIEVLDRAEAALVEHAGNFGPRELAKLGRRILEVVAPEVVDEAEGKRLRDLEAAARRRTRLTLKRCGDGTTRISGRIPDAVATRFATYLEAFANPRRAEEEACENPDGTVGGTDPLTRLPYPRRLGEAFCQLMESLDSARLPIHGGDATTVVITIDFDTLRGDLGAAGLLGSGRIGGDPEGAVPDDKISAGEARRLACNAKILPAILNGESEVLDLGRTQRLFSPAQRRALLIRDKTCRAQGCDIPGTWAEAHHWIPWSHGGDTDLDDGVLLCSHHHHRAHDDTYTADRLPNGDIRFARRS